MEVAIGQGRVVAELEQLIRAVDTADDEGMDTGLILLGLVSV